MSLLRLWGTHCEQPTPPSALLLAAGDVFVDLFRGTGKGIAIEVALGLYRAVLTSLTCVHDERRVSCLARLANALRICYSYRRHDGVLEEAITLSRQALELASSSDDRITCLWILGSSLRIAAENLSDQPAGQLDEALIVLREAVSLKQSMYSPNTASTLAIVDLGAALIRQYWQNGTDSSLHEAASLLRAVEIDGANEADRVYCLTFLANVLRIQSILGSTVDAALLTESMEVAKRALQLHGDWYDHLFLMDVFARIHLDRYDCSGDVSDLDQAIDLYRNAETVDPDYHLQQPAWLIGYSAALCIRFSVVGATKDLEDGIDYLYKCRRVSHTNAHRALSAVYLAEALKDRFLAHREQHDLEEAIALLREAYNLPSGHVLHHRLGCDLAHSLLVRHWDIRRSGEDLDEAISLLQCTLAATEGSTHTVHVLTTLGHALRLRHEHVSTGRLDLDEAFTYHGRAAALLAPGHHFHNDVLFELVQDSLAAFSMHHDTLHLDDAMTIFRSLMEDQFSTAGARFGYASDLVRWYGDVLPLDTAFEVYRYALVALPQLAFFGLEANAPSVLKRGSELANQAAIHALGVGREAEAIEFIELGRAVFWTKALQLRTRIDGLPETISEELLSVSRDLEASSKCASECEVSSSHRRKLADRYDGILHHIREIPGHEDFLLPAAFNRLRLAGRGGYIIILLAADVGCKAVILRPSSDLPQVLQLPKVTFEKLAILSGISTRAGMDHDDQTSLDVEMETHRLRIRTKRISTIENLLEDLWRTAVNPILQALAIPRIQGSRNRPRLFWCPTGRYVSIPLHAAGVYSAAGGACAADYVVQSYIPTVAAILHAQRPFTDAAKQDAIVLVAQPSAPGCTPLPKTLEEVNLISEIVGNATLLGGAGEDATVQAVSSALRSASVVHLACHGQQDKDALRSGFVMKDGLLTVADLMRLELPNASFAFLSACHAAAINPDNPPDEVLHLAATMLYSGFRSIIATMWSMNDADGPAVARVVYTEVFKDGHLDLSQIPYALDAAVQKLKDEGAPASRWATYIHIGM